MLWDLAAAPRLAVMLASSSVAANRAISDNTAACDTAASEIGLVADNRAIGDR